MEVKETKERQFSVRNAYEHKASMKIISTTTLISSICSNIQRLVHSHKCPSVQEKKKHKEGINCEMHEIGSTKEG